MGKGDIEDFSMGFRGYAWNILITIDQSVNTLFGGFPDETISSRLGKKKKSRGGKLLWRDWCGLAKPLAWALNKIDPGHCIDAIEYDEGNPVE